MPNVVIFDASYWVPQVAKPLGVKTIYYSVACPVGVALVLVPDRSVDNDGAELATPPIGFPSSGVVLRAHETRSLSFVSLPSGDGTTLYSRLTTSMKGCDAIATRTCRELEGKYSDYLASQYQKKVFMLGNVLPESDKTPLDDRWVQWLSRFEQGSVVYCSFGSEAVLEKKQFQEIVLGFETTGLPFLVALKPPAGASTVEEALPDGFEERVKGRGMVWGGWMQQLKILEHPSVGCFVTHCGFSSTWESLMSDCQIVMVPGLFDQILSARLLDVELKVGVEVVKDENGWVSKENLCKAIKSVMDKGSEVGAVVKKNHMMLREVLSTEGYMSSYIDEFVQNMQQLVM